MDKIMFGRYIPGDSFIHKMDPRTKLALCFALIILLFAIPPMDRIGYLLFIILTLVLIKFSEIKFKLFVDSIKPLLFLILITVVTQMLYTDVSKGHIFWSWGVFAISDYSMEKAVFMFLRFVLVIMLSTLLTLTTMPLSLADALEWFMKPLAKFRFPAHEISMMLAIALRFVPTLIEETQKIMDAQKSRGMDFANGSIIQKVKAIIPLLIPLFISGFNRAEDLAIAMEARGYRGGDGRTKYRQLNFARVDVVALLATICFFVLVLLLKGA
ncbi:MAG: energy-coupling factor transporter transmembrane protein EcfT [Lactobacillales bacterium]|jgi:energy-coupling factor transport system permease protein|nr:energy-coupling factor transporter transmembrane protein EcfT [Lactobacillales bacterium]